MVTVTIKHGRACGMCVSGQKLFFERHGLDFRNFAKNGIDAEILRALNDAMANQVIKKAEEDGI